MQVVKQLEYFHIFNYFYFWKTAF